MSARVLLLFLCLSMTACSGFPVGVRSPEADEPASTLPSIASSDRRAGFVDAYRRFRRGDHEGAAPIFAGLVESYPELTDYHLYFAAAAWRRSGDADSAVPFLQRLRREYPESTMASAAALELGQALLMLGRSDDARPYLQIAQSSGQPAITQPARLALADTDEHRGEYQAAASGFLEVRRAAGGTPIGIAAKKRLQALRAQYPVLDPRGRALVEEARLLLEERDYRTARSIVEAMLHAPAAQRGGVDEPDLLRLLADILYSMGDLDRALSLLRNLGDRYPGTEVAASALQRRAMLLWNRDRDDEALDAFAAYVDRYPRHARAAEAVYAIGRIHQQAGRPDLAIAAYERVVRDYPGSSLQRETRWRIGWVHYRNQRFDRAASAFAAIAGGDHDEAGYWQARALEHAGQTAAARTLYQRILRRDESSYYALWAERRLGRSRGPVVMTNGANVTVSAPEFPEAPAVGNTFHLDRARELAAIGVFDLARTELVALEEAQGDHPALAKFLLAAYPAVDGHTQVLRRLRRGARGLADHERDRLLYPLAFWSEVQAQAAINNLDPFLVVALMRQESLFDPSAHSPAGAHGLMQLMPTTAKRVAAEIDPGNDDPDLDDPYTNIKLGTRYLGALLTRSSADPLLALAAYNAGEAAVEKWQNRYGHLEPDELVESITYRETRDYVKKVVANYRKYDSLYR